MKIKKLIKNKEIATIVLLGLLLRFYKIKERFSWGTEQSLSLSTIVKFFEEKKLSLIGVHLLNPKSALFRPPFFTYIFALPLKIFKFDPFILEIIFALTGTIVIYIIYLASQKLFDKKTALLASLFYASSFFVIQIDKYVWTITPTIITSALVLLLLVKTFNKKSLFSYFFIGILIGLGFSFHFQIIVPLLAITTIILLKKTGLKYFLSFLVGLFLFLSPLILFNLRHDFIMLKGVKKIIFGTEVVNKKSSHFFGKINDSLFSFSDLSFQLIGFKLNPPVPWINLLLFLTLFISPLLFVLRQKSSNQQKYFYLYFILCSLFGLTGLTLINPHYGSTAFYLWFLIPLWYIAWANLLNLFLKKKKPYLILVIIFYLSLNNYLIFKQKPKNYNQVVAIVDNILNQKRPEGWQVKFINRDALAYDYIFYHRAHYLNVDFDKISLIEQWQEGNPNFFIIHHDYDWQKDKYKVRPYQYIKKINEVMLVVK